MDVEGCVLDAEVWKMGSIQCVPLLIPPLVLAQESNVVSRNGILRRATPNSKQGMKQAPASCEKSQPDVDDYYMSKQWG